MDRCALSPNKDPHTARPQPIRLSSQSINPLNSLSLHLACPLNSIKKPMKFNINGSWKASLFGKAGLIAVIADVVTQLADNDATTNPNWALVITVTLAALGNMFSKDADKSNSAVPVEKAIKVEP